MSEWPDAAEDDANDSMCNRPPDSAKESCDDGREWDTVLNVDESPEWETRLDIDESPEWETRLDIDESWDPHASTDHDDTAEATQDPV